MNGTTQIHALKIILENWRIPLETITMLYLSMTAGVVAGDSLIQR